MAWARRAPRRRASCVASKDVNEASGEDVGAIASAVIAGGGATGAPVVGSRRTGSPTVHTRVRAAATSAGGALPGSETRACAAANVRGGARAVTATIVRSMLGGWTRTNFGAGWAEDRGTEAWIPVRATVAQVGSGSGAVPRR